jgi:hypothetical protein
VSDEQTRNIRSIIEAKNQSREAKREGSEEAAKANS